MDVGSLLLLQLVVLKVKLLEKEELEKEMVGDRLAARPCM